MANALAVLADVFFVVLSLFCTVGLWAIGLYHVMSWAAGLVS